MKNSRGEHKSDLDSVKANSRKPYRHWDEPTVVEEIKKFIEDHGEFPTRKSLLEHGHGDLVSIIGQRFGWVAMRNRLGYQPLSRPKGYWKSLAKVKAELSLVIKQNRGVFPTQEYLTQINRCDLVGGIAKYHGGLTTVRKQMGYEFEWERFRRWNEVVKELEKVIADSGGKFPTGMQLREVRPPLFKAISKYHKGFTAVRQKLGYELAKKPAGYWKDFGNVQTALNIAIQENNGLFPTTTQLEEMGLQQVSENCRRYHGGMDEVRRRMGYPVMVRGDEQYLKLVAEDPTLRNLAAAALVLPRERSIFEEVIMEKYGNQFKSQEQIRELIHANARRLRAIVAEERTNLGDYLGDSENPPIGGMDSVDAVIDAIPPDAITPELAERFFRVLRSEYGPSFTRSPKRTLNMVRRRVQKSSGEVKDLYRRLRDHYAASLKIMREAA